VDLTSLPQAYIQTFILMSARIGPAMFTIPVFNSPGVPVTLRIGITMVLTYIFLPIQSQLQPVPVSLLPFVVMMVQEVIVGFAIGYVVTAFYNAIQMAGQVIGLQTGMNMAASLDPVMAGQNTSYLDQLYAVVAALTFLSIDGHHQVILALQRSFEIAPIGTFAATNAMQLSLLDFTAGLFAIALRIALPIVAALLATDVAFMLLGKMAPQMNLFMVEPPLKIGVAFLLFMLLLPVTVMVITRTFGQVFDTATGLIGLAKMGAG
jgi:flagellar biosynthesis protein FliR